MDNETELKHEERLKILEKISEYEKLGGENFFLDVENDPPHKVIKNGDVDYYSKKFSTKWHNFFGKILARIVADKSKKAHQIEVVGGENIKYLKTGAVITSNHFSPEENVAVWEAVKKIKRKPKFYRIIREGNYFFDGVFGYLLKYGGTIPLSSDIKTMMTVNKVIDKRLKDGGVVLIYPEKAMWWNYRKPRPYMDGAYYYAVKANVPIVPCFTTMEDLPYLDENGFPMQKYTIHVMPPIYPNTEIPLKEAEKRLKEENFELCKNKYEEVYGKKLEY